MDILIVFGYGTLGGFLGELFKWYKLRESENFPAYAGSFLYWFITILVIIAGGVLATIYGHTEINPIEKVQVGASTPLILQAFSTSLDKSLTTPQGKMQYPKGANMLEFLSGGG